MNQKILTKVLAITILITMLSANLSLIGEYVYATNIDLENQSTLTNNASVNFDAYFKDENGNKIHTIKADINQEVVLYIYGKVAEGYLKDIKVQLNNTNFEIEEDRITYGDIESIDSNIITINRIRRDEELEVAVPIKAIKSDEISLDMFNKQNEILMNAVLVKNNSKTKKISKTINTNVEWSGTAEAIVSQDILKYIPFEIEENKGVVLQTVVKTSLKDDTLPLKSTELNIEIPEISGELPKEVYVRLAGDNGVKFNDSNWNKIDNLIQVKVENKEDNGKVRWSKGTQDTYILTYVYDDKVLESIENSSIDVKLTTKAKITTYGNYELITEKEDIFETKLTDKLSDILITNLTAKNEVNKGYMYTGFATEYNEKVSIDIANKDLVDSIIIKENKDLFETEKNEKIIVDTKYKSTKINKSNFYEMLGKDGYIKIYNEDDELIATLDKNIKVDDNNNLVVQYDNSVKSIKLEISKVQNVGELQIENTKIIPANKEYNINEFNNISTEIEKTLIYNENEILNTTDDYTINLVEPTTQVVTNISNKKLSTLVENENVELVVVLKNSKINEKLYENPVVKIELPQYIEKIKFNDVTKILFTDELNIKNTYYDETTKIITIELEGTQTQYNDITVTEGTTLTLNANVTLKSDTPAMQDKIITTVTNKGEIATTETIVNYIIPNKDEEEKNEEQPQEDIPQNNEVVPEEQPSEQPNNENIQQEPNIEENNNQNEVQATEGTKQVADLQVMIQNNAGLEVREGQVINYTVTVVNMGKTTLNNITLEANIPQGVTYREFIPGGNYSYDEYITSDKTVCTKSIASLKTGEREILEYQVIVNEKQNGIEDIEAQAIAKIEGYEDTVSEKIKNTITDGILNVDLITKRNSTEKYVSGSEITYIAYVQNIKSVNAKNVKIKCKLPEGIEFKNAYFAVKMDNDGKQVEYNKNTNTVVWSLETVEANSRVEVQLVGTVNNNITEIKNVFTANSQGSTTIESNEVVRYVDKADLSISQYANIKDTYINVGDVLEYYITIKNNGTRTAEEVKIIDTLPSGLEKVTLKYKNGNEEEKTTECQNKEITLSGFEISAGETLNIVITAKVSELQKGTKGTINYTNKVNVSADGIEKIEANEITHKIKVKEQPKEDEEKKISISGIAWLDSSRDGKRDDNETILKDIEVRLITKDEKVISTTKTNKKGEYSFENVNKGEYLVVFVYDTSKYELTIYQAKDVVAAKNSDAALQKDSKYAVTDVITVEDANIYNIDIGLVEKAIFDLSLSKTISKVTVKNSEGMKSYEYKNKTLAKVEIASKEVNNTTAIIEYTITVKNEGNIAGYVKSIVDYLPNDLKFSSELNKDWFIGMNGNLYNESLANTLIQPGESKDIKLIVTKTMNENNLGTTNNSAEIAESYNNYGVQDIDSKAGNKASKEDDYGSADMLISLNTGTIVMYTGLSITMIALVAIAVYMIKKKVLI